MRDFVELRFEPGTWGDKGFREQGCWVRTATLDRVLEQGGELDIQDVIADLLDWLTIAPNRGDVLVTLSLPDEAIVTGCATDFCGDTTVRSALGRGFSPVVPEMSRRFFIAAEATKSKTGPLPMAHTRLF